MTKRRALFFFGMLGMVASAVRVGTGAEVELEGAAYTGTSTGGWICGPMARANYGGTGIRMRVAERTRDSERGAGWIGELGGTAEFESVHILDPRIDDHGNPEDTATPPDKVLLGGSIQGGYRWKWFGVEVGTIGFQGWEDHTDTTPEYRQLPNIRFSIGPQESWTIKTGMMASNVLSAARRPALVHIGTEVSLGYGQWLDAQWSWSRVGPAIFEDIGSRVDVLWKVPISSTSYVRSGGALSSVFDKDRVGAETSLALGSVF